MPSLDTATVFFVFLLQYHTPLHEYSGPAPRLLRHQLLIPPLRFRTTSWPICITRNVVLNIFFQLPQSPEHLSIRHLIAEQESCVLEECHKSANESNEEKGSETKDWLVRAKRVEEQLAKFLVKVAQVQQIAQENTALEAAEEVLTTKTIPTQEATQELEKWREPLSDEVASLVKELEVVEPTTQEMLDKLAEEPTAPVIVYVPGLAVFTRKQGTGRRRARICACGNFISPTAATEYEGPRSLSRHSLYICSWVGLYNLSVPGKARCLYGVDHCSPMNKAQREVREGSAKQTWLPD